VPELLNKETEIEPFFILLLYIPVWFVDNKNMNSNNLWKLYLISSYAGAVTFGLELSKVIEGKENFFSLLLTLGPTIIFAILVFKTRK